LFRCVRWANISPAETEYMMKKDFVLKSNNIRTFLRSQLLECSAEKCEGRGWPKMLVLVEKPNLKDRHLHTDSTSDMCSVQSYDSETKKWSRLSQVPDTSIKEGVEYSVTSVQNNLVLTWSNSNIPYIPIAVQTYDIWSDSWSKKPCVVGAEESSNIESHTTVEVKDKLYTVLVPNTKPRGSTMCLHIMSGLLTNSPLLSVASQPSSLNGDNNVTVPALVTNGDLVHVIGYRSTPGRVSLDTYNTATQVWSGEWLHTSDHDNRSSRWVGWDGGLARVGGLCGESGLSSDKFTIFPVQGGEGKSLASMVKHRMFPGVVKYKGMLFAAGGYRLVSASEEKVAEKKKRKKNKLKLEFVVEDSVEYYVPQLDSWNLMRTQPKLCSGNVSMVAVDKPIRLMSKGDVRFKVNRGVKRPLHSCI